MIRIALTEDEDCYADILTQYLHRFEREEGYSFSIRRYRDGDELTDPYPGDLYGCAFKADGPVEGLYGRSSEANGSVGG